MVHLVCRWMVRVIILNQDGKCKKVTTPEATFILNLMRTSSVIQAQSDCVDDPILDPDSGCRSIFKHGHTLKKKQP